MTIHTSHAPHETVDEAARNKAAHRSTMVSVWVNIVLASAQILIGVFAKRKRWWPMVSIRCPTCCPTLSSSGRPSQPQGTG
jgi:hypothetical protein